VDYASAVEVFAAMEALDADVAARLRAIAAAQPAAAAFAASSEHDRRRRRHERAGVAERLRVRLDPPAAPPGAVAGGGLRGLRDAQQALVHAPAEGLPALRDSSAVDLLARHMVALAAQLTVIDLWVEAEEGDA